MKPGKPTTFATLAPGALGAAGRTLLFAHTSVFIAIWKSSDSGILRESGCETRCLGGSDDGELARRSRRGLRRLSRALSSRCPNRPLKKKETQLAFFSLSKNETNHGGPSLYGAGAPGEPGLGASDGATPGAPRAPSVAARALRLSLSLSTRAQRARVQSIARLWRSAGCAAIARRGACRAKSRAN